MTLLTCPKCRGLLATIEKDIYFCFNANCTEYKFRKTEKYIEQEKEKTEMELCPNCKGTITYDAGGKKYCATKGCRGLDLIVEDNKNKVNDDGLLELEEVFRRVNNHQVADEAESNYSPDQTKRKSVDYLFTCLDWNFIKDLAKLGHWSGIRRKENMNLKPGYMENRYTGDKSPINHMINHTTEYICGNEHPLGSPKWHLVAIAFNAMMEFFWYDKTHESSNN